MLRGYRIPKASRKLDVVIVAVRYSGRGKKLAQGQAYLRRGLVWGDLVLLSRDELAERVKDGQTVVTGKPAAIPGEFIVFDHVRLAGSNGGLSLKAANPALQGDDLGLPLY